MNLYAILAAYTPSCDVTFMLAESDEQALEHGIYVAADDAVRAYGSTTAEVYCVIRDVQHIGTAYASDAPARWEWAHPGVEEAIAQQALIDAELAVEYGPKE